MQVRPGSQGKPTYAEIAEKSGVSTATVSRVFAGDANVSDEKRGRVLEAAAELGYPIKSTSAHLGLIGVSFQKPERVLRGHYVPRLLASIMETSRAYDKEIVLVHDLERELEDSSLLLKCLGVIVIQIQTTPVPVELFQKHDLPFVVIGSPTEEEIKTGKAEQVYHVDINQVPAAANIADYLVRTLGHTRIAMLTGPDDQRASHARWAGFSQALLELRGSPPIEIPGDFSAKTGERSVQEYLANPQNERFTAIFASNTTSAIGVLSALNKMHIGVPSQVSVVGFDNTPAGEFAGITCVDTQVEIVGKLATTTLLNIIEGRAVKPKVDLVPAPLLFGVTSGPPPD